MFFIPAKNPLNEIAGFSNCLQEKGSTMASVGLSGVMVSAAEVLHCRTRGGAMCNSPRLIWLK